MVVHIKIMQLERTVLLFIGKPEVRSIGRSLIRWLEDIGEG